MLRSGRSAAPFRRGQPLPALPWNRRGSATVQAGFWCGAAPRPVRLTVVIALIYVGGRRNAPSFETFLCADPALLASCLTGTLEACVLPVTVMERLTGLT